MSTASLLSTRAPAASNAGGATRSRMGGVVPRVRRTARRGRRRRRPSHHVDRVGVAARDHLERADTVQWQVARLRNRRAPRPSRRERRCTSPVRSRPPRRYRHGPACCRAPAGATPRPALRGSPRHRSAHPRADASTQTTLDLDEVSMASTLTVVTAAPRRRGDARDAPAGGVITREPSSSISMRDRRRSLLVRSGCSPHSTTTTPPDSSMSSMSSRRMSAFGPRR